MLKQSFWMLWAAFLFALMAVFIKFAASLYSVYEIIFYRSLFGVLLCFFVLRKAGVTIKTKHPYRHLIRCAIGTTCISLGVYILSVLPIATAQALNYTSPLWFCLILSISMILAKEKLDIPILVTVLIGFLGILLILRPDFNQSQLSGAIAGVLAGFTGGAADFMIRNLSQHREPKERIVFYFTLCGTTFGLLASCITGFSTHTSYGILILLGIGLTATFAQLSLTTAWSYGHPLLNSIFQFAGIPFAVIFSYFIFNEPIDLISLLGIAVITAAGVFSCVLRYKKNIS